MKKKKITQDKVVYFFNYVFLTLMLLIVLYPLIYIVSCSFSSGNALVSGKVKFLPVEPTLQSYKAVFEYRAIWVGYKNSIIYTVLGTLLSVALTLLAAYPLSREDLRGGKVFMALFLFTMMFSGGLIPTYLLVKNLGLVNTMWAVILPGSVSAYCGKNFFQAEYSAGASGSGKGGWLFRFPVFYEYCHSVVYAYRGCTGPVGGSGALEFLF